MKKQKAKLLKRTILSAMAGTVLLQASAQSLQVEATSGKWVAGEYHAHTTQSKDAGEKATLTQNVLDAAFNEINLNESNWEGVQPWELPVKNTDAEGAIFDYLVLTDHLRPAFRDPDGNSQNLAFYQGLQQQIEKIEELKSEGKYLGKTILSGFEMDMPGLDHAAGGILIEDSEELVEAIKEFEYLYSKETADSYFTEEDAKKYGERLNENIKENTYSAVQWLKDNYPDDSYLLLNHPSRKNGSSSELKIEDIRTMNDIAPKIVFGFEGIIGNQMSNDGRGETVDVYGGADVMLSEVGGIWDSLLGEGRRFFTFANSDFHFKVRRDYTGGSYSGYWPGEYSRNYTYVEGNDVSDIVDGWRSGKSFAVTGDLIDALDFSIKTEEAKAEMGGEMEATEGDQVTITIRFKSPEKNNYETIFGTETTVTNEVKVDHIDLISGEVTGISEDYTDATNETTKVIASFTSEDWTTDEDGYNVMSITVPAEKNCYYRLRGTNLGFNVAGETDENGNPLKDITPANPSADFINDRNYSDLWFYSNPVFLTVAEGNDNENPVDPSPETPQEPENPSPEVPEQPETPSPEVPEEPVKPSPDETEKPSSDESQNENKVENLTDGEKELPKTGSPFGTLPIFALGTILTASGMLLRKKR